jgi:hypothetical protein
VQYGFSEFVYASKNFNNKLKILNPFGVHETLLVPEKLTEKKTLTNLNANKVNILFIRIATTKEVPIEKNPYQLVFNFNLDGKVVTANTLNLVVKDYLLPDDDLTTSSVFIFSNYSRAANY